jgi:nicotinate-nucleotide adenylyltransferase
MRTLLYGGSFDPVTNAHVLCAREAMERGRFDSVIFIPTGNAPHKKNYASFADRIAMLVLAIHHEERMTVSGVEEFLALKGKTYTIDTYRHYLNYRDADYYWLIGSDILPKVVKWHEAEEVKKTIKFCVMERAGYACTKENLAADILFYGLTGDYVNSPLLEISSTYVRERVKKGLPIWSLVPDAVVDYISRDKLYLE